MSKYINYFSKKQKKYTIKLSLLLFFDIINIYISIAGMDNCVGFSKMMGSVSCERFVLHLTLVLSETDFMYNRQHRQLFNVVMICHLLRA